MSIYAGSPAVGQTKGEKNPMKTEFEYFEQLKKDYPDTMTKEQFYKAAHISKATALFLLQSGLVACKDSGKQTRRYTIKTNDVIAYLQDRILYPQKYAAPDGWYVGRSGHGKRKSPGEFSMLTTLTEAQCENLKAYFMSEMSDLDDVLSVAQLADFLGYAPATVVYDKAVEVVADTVKLETHKEDIKLVEQSKAWVLSPERKASKKEVEYAVKRLDGVIARITNAMKSTIQKIQTTLMKPEVKKAGTEQIKKKAKSSIIEQLSRKKKEIAEREVSRTDQAKSKKQDMEL